MSAEDLYMDDQFRKAASEQKFAYSDKFWNDARTHLDDASLDEAFKGAAGIATFMPDLNLSEVIDDAFLDEAFKTASENSVADYDLNAWKQFSVERDLIEQDAAFSDASNSVIANYQPVFWSDADIALQNEGLHFEYSAVYWKDAKHLLDRSDRKTFFFRWSAVAMLLLLLSAGGIYQAINFDTNISTANLSIQSNLVAVNSENDVKNIVDNISYPNEIQDRNLRENRIANTNGNLLENRTNNFSILENQTMNTDANISVQEKLVSTEDNHLNSHQENTDGQSSNEISEGVVPTENYFSTVSENSGEFIIDQTVNQSLDNYSENNFTNENAVIDLTVMPQTLIMHPQADIITQFLGPQIEIKKYQLKPSHTISFLGQAGFGNKYSVPEFVPSLRTSFGVEYKRSGFGKLRNFEFGGIVSMNHVRQNDFGTERRVNVFNLQGGMDKFWYKLQLKDMIYSNLSGLVTYKINSRHSLRLTLGVDYLVFVQSNMSYKVSADADITTVNNNWGVKDGLNKIDLRGGIGYEIGLTPRFALQMNGSFGFFDRTDNAFIDDNSFDHEMNVTLGLKYTFFRKI